MQDEVAGQREDAAGDDGDEGLDEENSFMLAEVEIYTWDPH